MGGCCGKEDDNDSLRSSQPAGPKKQSSSSHASKPSGVKSGSIQMRQITNWQATGLVGLRDQGLKEFPSTLDGLGPSCKVIDATNNSIKTLPPFFAQFSNLNRLVLTSNSISSLPAIIASLTGLKVLLVDLNNLQHLPDELGLLDKLQKLNLHGNQLASIPRAISSLTALTSLVVSHNHLAYLPSELSTCSNLEELEAANNQIASIPESLEHLKKLKHLNLDNNRVVSVPSSVLVGCVLLHTLSLHGNPITPDAFQETPGWDVYEARRRGKYNKMIAGGSLLPTNGLDEGVDRDATKRAR